MQPSKDTMIVPTMDQCCASLGGMGWSVCSTASLTTTANTGITRAIRWMEEKCARKAGKGQTVLIAYKM